MCYILSICITIASIWTGNLEWLTPAAIFALAGAVAYVGGEIGKITVVDMDEELDKRMDATDIKEDRK